MKWNNLFRFLSASLLALLLLALVLTGCTGVGDPTETTPGTEDVTAPATDGDITTGTVQPGDTPVAEGLLSLVSGSQTARVLVPPRCSDTIDDHAASIATMLSKKSGTKVSVETADATKYDANAVEILIGDVGYPEIDAVRSRLSLGSWNLSVEGNKVVVYAFREEWYTGAIQSLVKTIFRQGTGNVTVSKDLLETKVMNQMVDIAPKVEGYIADSFNATGIGDTCLDLFYEKQTVTDFRAYCTGLSKLGWTLYAENQIGDNLFATYTNDTHVINISIVPVLKRLTVAMESLENTDLQGLKAENTYTSLGCAPTVTQLGMWFGYSEGERWDTWINGMGYVIKLDDGSFIVIDGGHDRKQNDDNLYNTLKSQAEDPDHIRIAAWIFTHPHGDHVGTFLTFDHADVTVERFIVHFPSVSSQAGSDNSAAVMSRIHSKYPSAKVVTAHPGQIFYIRNVEIEMLWTLDMIYDSDYLEVNTASLVFTMTLNGHKTIFFGDQTNAETNKMVRVYGKELHSEIMQAPHHGFNGTALLYATVGPQYVWCPSGSEWQWEVSLGKMNGNDYFYGKEEITTWFAANHVIVVTFAKDQAPVTQTYEDIDAYLTAVGYTPNTPNS